MYSCLTVLTTSPSSSLDIMFLWNIPYSGFIFTRTHTHTHTHTWAAAVMQIKRPLGRSRSNWNIFIFERSLVSKNCLFCCPSPRSMLFQSILMDPLSSWKDTSTIMLLCTKPMERRNTPESFFLILNGTHTLWLPLILNLASCVSVSHVGP